MCLFQKPSLLFTVFNVGRLCPFFLGIMLTAALPSCNRRTSSATMIDFLAKTDTLAVKKVPTTVPLLMPTRLVMAGDDLVLYQFMTETPFVLFNRLPGGECFYAGHIGRGPEDVLSPDPRSFRQTADGFEFVEQDGMIKSAKMVEGKLRLANSGKVSIGTDPTNGILKIGQHWLNMNQSDNVFEYRMFNSDGSDPKNFSPYPTWLSGKTEMLPLFAYVKTLTVQPSGQHFAAFYARYRAFRIFGQDGNCLVERQVDFPDAASSHDDRFVAYSAPVSDERMIFALCRNESKDREACPEVHVWDWEGNLLRRLVLPCSADICTVDFRGKMLYACTVRDPDNLYVADLSTVEGLM